MKIRARGPNGLVNLSLEANKTLGSLKNELVFHGFPAVKSISVGFPARKIQNENKDSLEKCGINDGDLITVEASSKEEVKLDSTTTAIEVDEDKETVSLPEGEVIVRVMKDDNSCLFSSIGKLFLWDISPERIQKLRQMVSDKIISDPINYSAAILGKEPFEYCEWIRRENSWGGAIELKVFSEIFKTAITSVDVPTGRMDTFGEGEYKTRSFVMYSGIHYDVIVLTPNLACTDELDMVAFEGDMADQVEAAATKLAAVLKKKHRYTDLASFTLKCGVCAKGLVGQRDAQQHALSTGHAQFAEYQ